MNKKYIYTQYIYSISTKNAKNGTYLWVILGELLGSPLVLSRDLVDAHPIFLCAASDKR